MQCFYVWKDIPCVLTSLTQGEQNYDSWGLVAPRMSKTEQKKLVKKLTHRHMPQAYATHAHATHLCIAAPAKPGKPGRGVAVGGEGHAATAMQCSDTNFET